MSENNKVDKYINEYFDKKNNSALDANELFRLIEEAMSNANNLSEATIRSNRLFYYVRPDKLPKKIIKNIQEWHPGTEIVPAKDLIKALNDRLFVEQQLDEDQATFKFYLSVDGPVTRGDIATANRKKEHVGDMQGAKYLGDHSQKVQIAKTSISWLQTKPEELRAENEHLGAIKEKFKSAGIGKESPATIIITGSKESKEIKNVASIEKMKSKTAVGDFGLYNPDGELLFSISHKAIGFERYAAMVSTLKSLSDADKVSSTSFIKAAEALWKGGVFKGDRSPKGYYEPILDTSIVREVVYLIYGKTADKADALFIGEISLNEGGDNKFQLSVESQQSKAGNSASYLYPEIPKEESYLPIFRSRFGSGGSKIGFTAEEVQKLNELIKDESSPLSVELLSEMKVSFDTDPVPGTDEVLVDNVFLGVRWYISPMRRSDGGEEISSKDVLKSHNISEGVELPEEELYAKEPFKGIATSDLFKMIEEAMSGIKTQVKKYK